MKLSEAMMLGSLTFDVAARLDWNCCPLGTAANAVGIPADENISPLGLHDREITIPLEWPWLEQKILGCDNSYFWAISDGFEFDQSSFQDVVSFVQRVEPSCGDCNRFECTCKSAEVPVEEMQFVSNK